MPTYDTLRALAFDLRARAGEALPYQCWTLALPEEWKRALRPLMAERTGQPIERVGLPVDTLNKALRMLVPDLISIDRYAGYAGRTSWLVGARAIDTAHLDLILRAWARAELDGLDQDRVGRVLDGLRPQLLEWRAHEADLNSWYAQASNGTAATDDDLLYGLIPDALAARLSKSSLMFEFGREPRYLVRGPCEPGTSGAELVSWPPFVHVDHRRREWPFSAALKLRVQTLPFRGRPLVYLEVALKRWAVGLPDGRHAGLYLPSGQDTSVYLRTGVPWFVEGDHTRCFQVAPMGWQRAREGANGESGIGWGSALARLVNQLTFRQRLPDPAEVCRDPASHLNPEGLPNAAVVYRHGMRPDHGVGAGWLPRDRRDIFEQVRDTLSDLLEPLDLLDKVAIPVQPVRRPGRVVAARDLLEEGADLGDIAERQRRLRAAVAEATNGRFTLDLLYQNDEARDAVIAQARASLGLDSVPMPDGEGLRWDTEELSLTVRARLLGAYGDALQISPNGGRRDARRRDAMARRADETARRFAPVDGAAAALIELGGLDYWKHDPDADPKFAVRLGAARAGRPSQFLDLYDTEDKPHPKTGLRRIDHRAQQAWRDVLRQFGVQRVRASFAGPTVAVPSPLNYVAVWLISQTRFGSRTGLRNHLPVMVWMASDTYEVRVTAPGFDGQWLPYAQALTTIAGLDVFTNRGRSAPEVLQFIEQTLRRDVLTMGDALLLTHAQNLRGPWPWLTNKQLCPDQIRFGPAPTELITDWPGLRHVRVRTLDDGETPECFAERDEVQGFSKGLWDLRVGGRVYGSTGPKPVTAQQATGNVSKLQPWSSAVRDHEASPDVQAWNPSLVELTVAAIQPHDNPLVWAAIAHELRFMASHYDEATLLPLPLHLASLVEDYVLPMRLAASPNGEL